MRSVVVAGRRGLDGMQSGQITNSASVTQVPSVWLVLGDKIGDNAQVQAIADRLNWPYVVKRLTFREQYVVGKPVFRPHLSHIDLDRSDPLTPPWPDLVLTVGRRPSMAALWIRRQSGGHTKLVIVGRPRRLLNEFSLVLATPQYRLPARPNVMHLDLPLMRVEEGDLAAIVAAWQDRLAGFPRPLTAVMVGGPTKPFIFNADVARDFVRQLVQTTGDRGSLYVTTSRRTPKAVVEALAGALPARAHLFRWQPNVPENPYRALLGLADRFVVTGDSVSMIVEVARLGKPLAIYPLPVTRSVWDRARLQLAEWFQPPAGTAEAGGPLARLGDLLYDLGLVGYARDFSVLHRRLVARGAAVFLGAPFPPKRPQTTPDDLPAVAARIRGLFPQLAAVAA